MGILGDIAAFLFMAIVILILLLILCFICAGVLAAIVELYTRKPENQKLCIIFYAIFFKENKIQIAKYIVKFKQEEIEERLQAKDKKEYNQKLLELIERKQNEELAGKSIEELQAMLKA